MADVSGKLARARQLADAGRLEQARAEAASAVQKAPRDPAANATLSRILALMGRIDPAITFARAALVAAPGHPQLLADLGGLLMDVDAAEAEELLTRAAAADPRSLPAAHNLASVLLKRHKYAAALAACDRGLELRPGWDELVAKRTFALQCLGRSDEALAELETAAAAQPRSLTIAQALAVGMQYGADDPERALAAHRRVGALVSARGAGALPARPLPAAGAPVRVGLLSGDFRRHSVAYFVRPIIERLDRERFPLTCYFTSSAGDATTAELRNAAPAWRDVAGMDDAALAGQIQRDGIDVLIELSGWTKGERLRALVARPAAVQATYLGYPNTTGIEAVDFRIVDSTTDPAPAADAWAVERLARLDPCFLCFRPPAGAPDAAERRGEGPIVFGSFNAPTKIGPRVIRLWARVLDAVPGSRLLVKNAALDEPEGRAAWAARFAAAGIGAERLELRGFAAELGDHLRAYEAVDVALDTYPYAGTTTTCEAVFMGVPVVTLAGRSHASRVGLSLLTAMGLSELAANDEDGYVRTAAGLAADRGRLRALRRELRGRLLGSSVCDEAGFVRRFEGVIAAMVEAQRSRGGGAGAS